MARVHGKNSDFVFNSVPLEGELNKIDLSFDVPAADITSFGDAWQNAVAGKPMAKVDASGSWDPAGGQGDATIYAALGGPALTWDFEPDGTTGYNGYAVVTSYKISSAVNAAVTYSVAMQHNGTAAAADGAAPNRA